MRSFLANSVVNLAFLAIVLACAGRWNFIPAWIYFGIGLANNLLMRAILRGSPELAAERAKPGPGSEAWDRRLLALGFLLSIAMLVVAGIDAGRFGPTPIGAWPWTAAGLAGSLAGMALFLAALRANSFFSAVVRIQRDHAHAVCASGPYRLIRHPGNAGMILGTLAFPLLFGSPWSAIPALLATAVLVRRTALEDEFLACELDGYRDYQRTTRARLVPGIW